MVAQNKPSVAPYCQQPIKIQNPYYDTQCPSQSKLTLPVQSQFHLILTPHEAWMHSRARHFEISMPSAL